MSHDLLADAIETPAAPAPEPDYPEAFRVWLDICRDYPYLRYLASPHGNEAPPPPPMKREAFAALIGTLRDRTQAPALRECLIDLLAEAIDEIAVNAIERAKRGRRKTAAKAQQETAADAGGQRQGDDEAGGQGEGGGAAADAAAAD